MSENSGSDFVVIWVDALFDKLKKSTDEEARSVVADSGEIFRTLTPKDKEGAFFWLLGKVKRDEVN